MPSAAKPLRAVQYAAQLADLALLPQAFAYVLASSNLATKARGDRRASNLNYDPDALLAMAQELHTRLQAHAAAVGAPQAPAGRGLMGKVGSFFDSKVMSLLATDDAKGVQKSASAVSLTSQARRPGAAALSSVVCERSLVAVPIGSATGSAHWHGAIGSMANM